MYCGGINKLIFKDETRTLSSTHTISGFSAYTYLQIHLKTVNGGQFNFNSITCTGRDEITDRFTTFTTGNFTNIVFSNPAAILIFAPVIDYKIEIVSNTTAQTLVKWFISPNMWDFYDIQTASQNNFYIADVIGHN